MNYLAHLYLSGLDDERLMIGNFIADKVKGRAINEYPVEIRRGLYLHREIDNFTDHHEKTSALKRRFQKECGHYSGVVSDLVYDYCLAKNWKKWHSEPLSRFSLSCYFLLIKNWYCIPSEMHGFVMQFISTRRLTRYGHESGIESTIKKMHEAKSTFPDISKEVREILHNEYEEINGEFEGFFKEMIQHTNECKRELYRTIR